MIVSILEEFIYISFHIFEDFAVHFHVALNIFQHLLALENKLMNIFATHVVAHQLAWADYEMTKDHEANNNSLTWLFFSCHVHALPM